MFQFGKFESYLFPETVCGIRLMGSSSINNSDATSVTDEDDSQTTGESLETTTDLRVGVPLVVAHSLIDVPPKATTVLMRRSATTTGDGGNAPSKKAVRFAADDESKSSSSSSSKTKRKTRRDLRRCIIEKSAEVRKLQANDENGPSPGRRPPRRQDKRNGGRRRGKSHQHMAALVTPSRHYS